MPIKVARKEYLASPGRGTSVGVGVHIYTSTEGLGVLETFGLATKGDRTDETYLRRSSDNGRTWSPAEAHQCYWAVHGGPIRVGDEAYFYDPEVDRVLQLRTRGFLKDDDPYFALKTYFMEYRVSSDGGRTFPDFRPLVEEGYEFNETHWCRDVWRLQNCAMAQRLSKHSSGVLLAAHHMTSFDEQGNLSSRFYVPRCFLGRWNRDASDLVWRSGEPVMIEQERSTVGLAEPTLAELPDGSLLMAARGHNHPRSWFTSPGLSIAEREPPRIPGRKWYSLSKDCGLTWTPVQELLYDTGEPFYSPASICTLIRHSSGRLFFIGNIVPENPIGNSPRYPLIIAKVDEQMPALRKDTVSVIDTRQKDESEHLQLCCSSAIEDRETGCITLFVSRLFANGMEDWTCGATRYDIEVD